MASALIHNLCGPEFSNEVIRNEQERINPNPVYQAFMNMPVSQSSL